ncbi:MAG TPA: RNA polymerase sigma-54 factor [Gammaproteobacteria bacterium]|jgi:RNA polymerase sigma-54 factor|nr:RNA polymerase sigma-54 factor [Gammaproteobacteria bacterium]
MKQALQLKTSQQQKLTPQMQQSLRILQLGSQELAEEVQTELDDNPLLEELEQSFDDPDPTLAAHESERQLTQNQSLADQDYAGDLRNDHDIDNTGSTEFEPHWEEILSSGQETNSNSNNSSINGEYNDATHNLSTSESLVSHLFWQIRMTTLSERDVDIARTILHSLDEEGYLKSSPQLLLQNFDPVLDVQEDEIAAVLSMVKTLEPIGVGARSLSERLCILLRHKYEAHSHLDLACTLCTNHLDLLARKNMSELRAKLGCSQANLESAIDLITSISPRVTSNFGDLNKHQITPDLIVKKHSPSNMWRVSVNPINQHRLKVNQEYAALLDTALDDSSSEFIRDKLQQAKSFIKNLMSRYDTLQLVGQTIVERQSDFFESGELGLKAMVLSDIAGALDLHESTISRATAGKYLQCPAGVFELKYFFSTALGNDEGEGASATAVRSLIKRIIDGEDKAKPLSDNKIMNVLVAQNHQIARRTVAKYRESLNIPAASQRKSIGR